MDIWVHECMDKGEWMDDWVKKRTGLNLRMVRLMMR